MADIRVATSETLSGTITTEELDITDQRQLSDMGEVPDSGIDGANIPDVQRMPAAPVRLRLRLANPERPIRYIPIHVWWVFCAFEAREWDIQVPTFRLSIFRPEHLKKMMPRTGRRYSPKRSRTLQKRNASSPRTLKLAVPPWTECLLTNS